MKTRTSITRLSAAALLALACASMPAQAQESKLLDSAQTVRDNLQRLAQSGKKVELVLKNGKSYKGKLGSVGDHAVVVTEIEGREFFDALVVLDEIEAVEVRARDR